MMNLNNYFVCPICGEKEIMLHSARPIMSDVRVDALACNKCGAVWNLYSKVTEAEVDIQYVPQTKDTNPVNEESKETPTEVIE